MISRRKALLSGGLSIDFKPYFGTLAGKATYRVNLKNTLYSLLDRRSGDYQEVSHE